MEAVWDVWVLQQEEIGAVINKKWHCVQACERENKTLGRKWRDWRGGETVRWSKSVKGKELANTEKHFCRRFINKRQ